MVVVAYTKAPRKFDISVGVVYAGTHNDLNTPGAIIHYSVYTIAPRKSENSVAVAHASTHSNPNALGVVTYYAAYTDFTFLGDFACSPRCAYSFPGDSGTGGNCVT